MNFYILTIFALLQALSVYGFDAQSKTNVAVYWGQASAGSQESLATYCESGDVDIVLLSFLYAFPNPLKLDFSSACSSTFSDGLLHCSQIASDIKTCQGLGKKVFLSLGGESGAYGFSDDSEAESFADTLWNTFGEGSGSERPFDDAVVDGFDFDIENNNQNGYVALAKKLRQYYNSASKDFYISAAPQCYYPDASVGNLLSNAEVDFAFIQFYNNYCNVDKQFNWDTWQNFAETVSPNSDIKLFLGLPGSPTAAGSGYISDTDEVSSTVKSISSSSNFGGIMLWDASQSFKNTINGKTYVSLMKDALEQNVLSSSSAAPAVSSAAPSAVTSGITSASTLSSSTSASGSSSSPSSSSTSDSFTSVSLSSASIPPTTSVSTTTSSSITSTIPATTTGSTSTPSTTPVPVYSSQTSNVATANAPLPFSSTNTFTPSTLVTQVGTFSSAPAWSSTPVTNTPSSSVTPETTSSASASTSNSQQRFTTTLTPTSAAPTSAAPTSAPPTSAPPTSAPPTSAPPTSALPTSTATTASTQETASSSWAHDRAIALNKQYSEGQMNGSSECFEGEISCSADGQIAICDHNEWVYMECAAGTTCYAYDSDNVVFTSCNFSYLKSSFQ
ncbi:LAMI_0C06128g1_1 [Lachancea mirantina]|uniref:chitinase n=1 Tax=Lachancea mirantina TaxID=1230905 RepID=A0A1G4J350_9SACH|nr:LAMI_0C06128g1_1 [Lachancea mirantina]